MKLIIYSILTIAWLIYLSEPTIKLKPFSVSFNSPHIPFAWLFLIIAVVLFQTDSRNKGYKNAINDVIEEIHKQK